MILNQNQSYESGIIKEKSPVYTPNELANFLKISRRQAYYLCSDSNLFQVIKLGQRCTRIDSRSFEQWFHGSWYALDTPISVYTPQEIAKIFRVSTHKV